MKKIAREGENAMKLSGELNLTKFWQYFPSYANIN